MPLKLVQRFDLFSTQNPYLTNCKICVKTPVVPCACDYLYSIPHLITNIFILYQQVGDLIKVALT